MSKSPNAGTPKVLAGLCLMAAVTAAQAASDDKITSYVLSSGGVAQVQRQVQAHEGRVSLTVPRDQVDDILKSLVVQSGKSRVAHLVLDGDEPVHEAFAQLPFGQEALGAPETLLASLPGASVKVSSGGRSVQGRVLGVKPAGASSVDSATLPLLSVMTADGQVQTLALGSDTLLDVQDEGLRDRLQAALAASGQRQTGTMRRLVIQLDGAPEQGVGLSYVVPAPVWKSAYRLLLGERDKARLQAWAVLENATGSDWDGVDVTLASGAPVVLAQKLYQRYWHPRQELPIAVGVAERPRTDTHEMMAMAAPAPAAAMGSSQMRMRRHEPVMAEAMADMAQIAQADAQEGQTSVSYRLPETVSAAAGQTVSVPFLEASLPAEQVSVFQADGGSTHPVAAIWLKNDTKGSLPPGILTVYDLQAGHMGDAQLAALPTGESRFIYFAQDRKVDVRAEDLPLQQLSHLTISRGVLQATRKQRIEHNYTIKGAADAARTLIIEQPRQSGWAFSSDALTGETATHYRLKVAVPAGKTVTVKAVSERTDTEATALLDGDESTLLRWQQHVANDAAKKALNQVLEKQRAWVSASRQVQALETQIEEASSGQARIRENLAAVPPDSELGQRYMKRLAQEEDSIEALTQQLTAARSEAQQRQQALEAALEG